MSPARSAGTNPGDSVRVWFEGKEAKRVRATRSRTGGLDVDSAGWSSRGRGLHRRLARASAASRRRSYLSFYTDALTANGVAYDVYDVDANGRTAPDNLGVLSHYDAVVWYTGDDVVTREPGGGPATRRGSRCRRSSSVRDY